MTKFQIHFKHYDLFLKTNNSVNLNEQTPNSNDRRLTPTLACFEARIRLIWRYRS